MTIVAILKETTHNVLAQIGKAAKRITLYHASSQGGMAGVINIMHGCYTSKKAKKKKRKKATQFAIFTEQKKQKEVFTNKLALTHAYNLLTPLLSSHLQSHIQFSHTISSVTQQLAPVTHLQSHMMLDTHPESILV